MRRLLLPAAALVCYGAAVLLGTRFEAAHAGAAPEQLALPAPEVAKVVSLGFNALAADLYFLRALQYFGNAANYQANYEYLAPLVNLVAELDPRFSEPLLWGGVAVTKNLGKETWVNVAESTRLLRKGADRFPDDYRFHMYLAYNLMVFAHDYLGAADELRRAIPLRGAPTYLAPLVSRLYSTAGDLEAAETFSEALAQESVDPGLQEVMRGRILDVQTERILRQLDAGADEYQRRYGARPRTVLELVSTGIIPTLPVDPRGGELYVDPDGTFRSTKLWKRLKLFDPKEKRDEHPVAPPP
jgi:hypothetical protein